MKIIAIPTPNKTSVTLGYPSARAVIEAAVSQGYDFMLISSTLMGRDDRHTVSNAKACLAALLRRDIDSDMAVKTWESRGQTCWRFGVIAKHGRTRRWRLYHFKTRQTHLDIDAMFAAQAEAVALHADLGALAPRSETRSPISRSTPRL